MSEKLAIPNPRGAAILLEPDYLPEIRTLDPSHRPDVVLLIIPLNQLQRHALFEWYRSHDTTIPAAGRKEAIKKYLEESGLALGVDIKTGALSLLGRLIPARDIHDGIRRQGSDPNELARWLAGRGYNLLSKHAPEGKAGKYYAVLDETNRFEVGLLSYPKGEGNLAPSEVVHAHPHCSEIFIVTKGKITIIDRAQHVSRAQGKTVVEGQEIVLDMERATNPQKDALANGVKIHQDRKSNIIALSYSVRPGSYHLLSEVAPGTELILAKRSLSEQGVSNWTGRVLHPDEKGP